MARLFGTEIPNEKRIEASLPYIYGIGRSTSKRILEQAGINPDIRTGQLTDEQLTKIVQVITTDGILIEGDLRREKQSILKRLTSINCYRATAAAFRYAVSVPARMPAPVKARRRPLARRPRRSNPPT